MTSDVSVVTLDFIPFPEPSNSDEVQVTSVRKKNRIGMKENVKERMKEKRAKDTKIQERKRKNRKKREGEKRKKEWKKRKNSQEIEKQRTK